MAKKSEYPQSRHILARLQTIIEAQASARIALQNVQEFALEIVKKHAPGKTGEIIAQQIADALAALDMASGAISGGDDA